MDFVNYIGAGLAVGLAGIGVAIGQGILAKKATEVIGRSESAGSFYLTVAILGIALVESSVIYGLIIALKVIATEGLSMSASIGAGVSIGFAGMGVGIGEGFVVSSALGAMEKNFELRFKLMTYMVLFIALVESAAIYGLLISLNILGAGDFSQPMFLGMGLAMGLAAVGVSIGEGMLGGKALENMGKRPEMQSYFLTIAILGIALVESAAIYGLIVALRISAEVLPFYTAIAAGLSIGVAAIGAGIGEGFLIKGALDGMIRNPAVKSKTMAFMILFLALVESVAIYGLVVAFMLISKVGVEGFVDVPGVLGAGIAIGFAALGVGVGAGMLAEKTLSIMGKNPKLSSFFLTLAVLGVALIESAAIYGLIIAFTVMNSFMDIAAGAAIGAGVAIGLAGLGAGIGEGILAKGAVEGVNANPENKGKGLAFMVLFVALIEVVAIYGLIIALRVLGS